MPMRKAPAGSFAPMMGDKLDRRAAMSEAGVFQGCELVYASKDQHQAAKQTAGGNHHGRHQTDTFQTPLQGGRQ